MDDLESELWPVGVVGENESSDDESVKSKRIKRSNLPLAPPLIKETSCETGFHKTTRTCLQQIKEAMLHHRWQEAAEYMSSYSQILEDTTGGKSQVFSEMIWRIGAEIFHHHPNSKKEDYNSFLELMKNSGVKHYLKVCQEHSFHFLLNRQFEDAKRQLSIAESWRYGKQSASQPQTIKLIQAYSGFLDYFIWCEKRSTISSADDPDVGASQEMHSYFRQSSVNLKEIIKLPGVWDSFVLSYIDMLEFYNDHEGALKVLKNYAYDNSFPLNPNAHVYLYQYLKKHNAPQKKLRKVLKVLHALVPSHELMLEYCSLLLQSEKEGGVQKALGVVLDLLDYASWKNNLDVWNYLMTIINRLKLKKSCEETIAEEMVNRKDWWPALHFTIFQARKDFAESRELLEVKISVVKVLCPHYTLRYCSAVRGLRGEMKTENVKKQMQKKTVKPASRRRRERRRAQREQKRLKNA